MSRRSALEPLVALAIDREDERRGRPGLFDELLADPRTRVLPLWHGKALTAGTGTVALDLLEPDRVTSALIRVYLGTVDGTPVITVTLTDAAAAELEPDETRWRSAREVGASLPDRDYALVIEALAIANWHESHTHCPRCGTPTVVEHGGWVRRCFNDGREVFPRTDPAVIVRVLDGDDRILLGSNAAWESNRWSLFAGFVEPGESFEEAVLREVMEESGVRVAAPRYLGSQPWPFPASVMIGFEVRAVDADAVPQPDGQEILAARWFSREDIWAERDDLRLPPPVSIAHAIIRDWYGGPLDEPPLPR